MLGPEKGRGQCGIEAFVGSGKAMMPKTARSALQRVP